MLRLALIPVVFAGVAGCAADGGDEGLIVIKNVAPAGTTCTFSASADEPFFSHGLVTTKLSAISPAYYQITPQIKSRITALDTETDTKTVITDGADIDISFADDSIGAGIDSSLTHFRQPFSAPVFPNGGLTDASFVLLPTELIDAIAANGGANFATEVITTFTIRGKMSGSDIESQKFTYGVTVSSGGIVNDVSGPTGCPARTGITIRTGNPCNIAQDEPVDCCFDADGPKCPAAI